MVLVVVATKTAFRSLAAVVAAVLVVVVTETAFRSLAAVPWSKKLRTIPDYLLLLFLLLPQKNDTDMSKISNCMKKLHETILFLPCFYM